MLFLTKTKDGPCGAYVPPMSNPVPMPKIEPQCKIHIDLTCSLDNMWTVRLGEKVLFLANSHQEMIDKLTKFTEIMD